MAQVLKFSTEGCGQCKVAGDRMRKAGIDFDDVDLDGNELLFDEYNIRHVPVVVVLHEDGVKVYDNLRSIIDNLDEIKRFSNDER